MSATLDTNGLARWLATRGLSDSPLCGEAFAKGDKVTFTNDYGVTFSGLTITGFDRPIYDGSGTIYTNSDAYWFPKRPHQLKKEA
jgi:hypothetical protein